MQLKIDLSDRHLDMVKEVLVQNLPIDAKVWVFGSRANGKARRGSDLDLVVDKGQILSYELMSQLAFAFEDSDLPFMVDMVDVVDVPRAGPNFMRIIQPDMVPLIWQDVVVDQ